MRHEQGTDGEREIPKKKSERWKTPRRKEEEEGPDLPHQFFFVSPQARRECVLKADSGKGLSVQFLACVRVNSTTQQQQQKGEKE